MRNKPRQPQVTDEEVEETINALLELGELAPIPRPTARHIIVGKVRPGRRIYERVKNALASTR